MTMDPPSLWRQAGRNEKLGLAVSYLAAYLYTAVIESASTELWLTVFTLLFCAGVELVYRREPSSREHWVWLGAMLVILASVVTGRDRVWGGTALLFLHAYAVYWLMVRSGRMAEKGSGRYFLLDLVYFVLVVPFANFFLRIRLLWSGLLSGANRKTRTGHRLSAVAAVLLSLVLLVAAGLLLSAADPNFGKMLEGLLDWTDGAFFGAFLWRFLLSLPVGAYLYGLVLGSRRTATDRLPDAAAELSERLRRLRMVPAAVWTALVSLFVALYLVFFVLQGSYLFGAFTGTLPDSFTVAQYARQGFFELCAILGLNFVLLFAVQISSSVPVRQNRPLRAVCVILLIQGIFLAVTALSKLGFYISEYGFTPLRWQSTWLVTVLLAGCGAALYSVLRGRSVTRAWLLFSGISLAVLHLL